ncbi:hypothetical protein HTZ84_02565 [Haloterrigena sp. SYSU A558-1]|uniref:Uncharacterized protein n=1 Tax=Haloterrigena gelatinilytica TaxID=2741724 RepID=A0A8J8GMR8_9EURY|nr:hypothetical protein [Haloterrigena gelatinilytica]NUB92884.1 hypothetical protein [Haloterrigena gelatinilytica]NUC71204.1 hypothetical protein [Haloterrigena gelatinilytica]
MSEGEFEFLYSVDIVVVLALTASAISLYMYFYEGRDRIGLVMSVTALLLVGLYMYTISNYLVVTIVVLTAISMVGSSLGD